MEGDATSGFGLALSIMNPTIRLALVLIALLATAAADASANDLWPGLDEPIADIGRGAAVVFTPDLSVGGNCDFYTALGFACFDTADWNDVLEGIAQINRSGGPFPIQTVILETHGTNGNGLKLQESKHRSAPRSYISVGALEEKLGESGVTHVILSACNSGRLLRPSIYRRLDRATGDKLFLPATRGIIDASERFDPAQSRVRVFAPEHSRIETTILASLSELTPATRAALARAADERGIVLPARFAISDMLMQILVRDPALRLRIARPVAELSAHASSPEESERLFMALVKHLDHSAQSDGTPHAAGVSLLVGLESP